MGGIVPSEKRASFSPHPDPDQRKLAGVYFLASAFLNHPRFCSFTQPAIR